MSYFFKPQIGICADFIPFFENGTYYLFYLKDYRDVKTHGEGTPWCLVTTKDFVTFEEHGEILPRGGIDDQDLYVYTGSVIHAEGQYHIFYTGHNPYFRAAGKPEEAIMHAVSNDLLHWIKKPEDTFFAPTESYEPHDWRDPFVFFDEESQEYHMLLAARCKEGIPRRRGVTALCASKDLKEWHSMQPMWTPARFVTHECPDLFQMGEWYYLLYSEFSEEKVTRYCMSRSLDGPWISPVDDRFDGSAYYAAKSAGDKKHRCLFGWIPSRCNDSDDGEWQWGGHLCTYELLQRADGTLYTCLPQEIVQSAISKGELQRGECSIDASQMMKAQKCGEMPECGLLDITLTGDCSEIVISVLTDGELNKGHHLKLDFARGTMCWDQWPRNGEVSFIPGLARIISSTKESHHLQLLWTETALCACLDGETTLCTRAYSQYERQFGCLFRGGCEKMKWIMYN